MSEAETKPYRPSNSTEGMEFEHKFCRKCEYDREGEQQEVLHTNGCLTLSAGLCFEIGEQGFPDEWISDADGSNPRCTRFRQLGTGTWEQAAKDQAKYDAAMAEMRAAQGKS